jgi:hypothetical protein
VCEAREEGGVSADLQQKVDAQVGAQFFCVPFLLTLLNT